MENYEELSNNSRSLVSGIFDEWNKVGRAEFMKQYKLASDEARANVQKIFGRRYSSEKY